MANITSVNRAVFKSVRTDWPTPRKLFDELHREFRFTLDVCASRENAKCDRYFTEADDGLRKPWAPEVCWMNPPYGPDLKYWMGKAFLEWVRGATVVCLVPARTDTFWWNDWAIRAAEVRFIRGRLRFGDGAGKATFPSCLVVFRGAAA